MRSVDKCDIILCDRFRMCFCGQAKVPTLFEFFTRKMTFYVLLDLLESFGRNRRMICDLQKASLWKRISSLLFDFIILAVVAIGIGVLMSALVGVDNDIEAFEKLQAAYEEKYGIKFDDYSENYDNLTEEELKKYEEADRELNADKEIRGLYEKIFNKSIIIAVVGILWAYMILEFMIPLIFGNGQTLGKKIFGLAVMRTNSVKAKTIVQFIRMLLGKFTIETMVPVFMVIMVWFGVLNLGTGLIIVAGILILEIIAMATTRTNSAIHDLLADTVVVDVNTQMIFENEQEMIAYMQKIHEEKVSKTTY